MMQLKLGARGEVVIPKKIRDTLGLSEAKKLILEVKDGMVILRPVDFDIVKKWAENAKRTNADVSKWVLGDKLYEEVFG